MNNYRVSSFLACAAILTGSAIAGCSSGAPRAPEGAGMPVLPVAVPTRQAAPSPIKHIVIVIQENRSFDDLFATFKGANGATHGKTHNGHIVPLKKANLVEPDIGHAHKIWAVEYDNGKMDGFDLNLFLLTHIPAGTYPYQYVDPAQIKPYWDIAEQYVLADNMFQTQGSDSFSAHQDLIAGGTAVSKTASIIDNPSSTPWGCDSHRGTKTTLITASHQYLTNAGPFPCLTYPTLRDRLDAKSVSWRYYTPPFEMLTGGAIWNAFDAIRIVRKGPEWNGNVLSPETRILDSASKGTLPSVTWVVPDIKNSDHPGDAHDYGPSWVAQIVNAIGESKEWNSTAIVVVWDDWGGFYDHVRPKQLDYQGLGFRVPCLIVSPYVKRGYVSHTPYEFGSILAFVEDNFGLDRVGTTDVRATSIGDVFDFTQAPRTFVPIAAPMSRAYFEHETPSNLPVDDE